MASNEEIEIYRQRYETYRHLDKLRWQMLQISVAVAPLVLAFSVRNNQPPPIWSWVAIGIFLLITGWVMERIRTGVNKNATVLKKYSEILGDADQPDINGWKTSSAFWTSFALRAVGAGSIAYGLIKAVVGGA